MIFYNNRYRGPYEYDKFMLNILALHNMLESLKTIEIQGTAEDIITLKSVHSEINDIFTIFTGNKGISENAFLLAIKEKECINR